MISSEAIREFARTLSGYVLLPGDTAYEAAIKIDNGRIQLRPQLIIRPTTKEDVGLALKFSISNSTTLTIKAGGHSAAGYCMNDGGIVLDLVHLDEITFDSEKRTLKVQMGARWRAVYGFMEKTGTGLIPVGGGCPSVAPAGFMQGGGYSFVSRSYGMGIDNLVRLVIVTPDGHIHDVGKHSKAKHDQDLFWACCGGGGGNFGIVVEMEMEVQKPKSDEMLVGQIWFPLEQIEQVFGVYNDWVETIPDEMAVYGFCGQRNLLNPSDKDPRNKTKLIGLTPVYNGQWAKGLDLLNPILKLNPIMVDLHRMTLPAWESYNGNTTLVENRSAYIRSLVLPAGGMNKKVAKVFLDYMTNPPSQDSFVVWTLGGGAISKRAPGDTAFVHRNARFIPEVKCIWNADQPGDARKNVEWAYNFFEAIGKAGRATGAYVNYIDPLLHNWPSSYYGDNYARLLEIKKRVDPDGVFHFQQSIGSPFNPPNPPFADLSPLNRTELP